MPGLTATARALRFSTDGATIDQQVAELLLDGRRIALGESCTAGLLAARIADPPGASRYLAGGVVAYSNEAKVELLGVPAQLIDDHGAVSPEVAEAMADGAIERFRADLGVGITGIAGPDGGTEDKASGIRLRLREARWGRGARARPGDPGGSQRHPRPLLHARPASGPAPAARRGLPALDGEAEPVRDRCLGRGARGPGRAARPHPLAGAAGGPGLGARLRLRLPARALRPLGGAVRLAAGRAGPERALELALGGDPLHLGAGAGRRAGRAGAAGAAPSRLAGRRDRVSRPDPAPRRRRPRRDRPVAAGVWLLRRTGRNRSTWPGRPSACGPW